MNLQKIRNRLERKKGQKTQIEKDLNDIIESKKTIEESISNSEKAQAIIQAVAQATQKELQYRICDPVSLALAAVYDNPYKMSAKFEITGRGTTECHLGFERNGSIIKPTDASGGGPIDIASFALRVGAWSLAPRRSRNVLFLDEPFRWISRNKIPLAGVMLKSISRQLNLQIIMVTHIEDLIDCADKILEVSIDNGISNTEELIKGDI